MRLVLAVVLLPLTAHFVWSRINARPAFETDAIADRLPIRTAESQALVDACAALPSVAEVPPPPAPAGKMWAQVEVGTRSPAGYRIVLRRTDDEDAAQAPESDAVPLTPRAALLGEWTPATRHRLAQIVRHLESPEMSAALDEVARLAMGPHDLSAYFPGGASLYRQGGPEEQAQISIDEGFFWLLARGRYLLEAGRPAEACRDYAAALRIADSVGRGPAEDAVQAGTVMRIQAVRELANQVIDRRWPADTLKAMAELLRADGYDAAKRWAELRPRLLAGWSQRLDRWYTRDANGDGFRVVVADWGKDAPRVLNLFSPLYDSRATLMRNMARHLEACTDRWLAGYDAWPAYSSLTAAINLENLADPSEMLRALRSEAVATREAILLVATHRFRAERTRFPRDLNELVPAYVATIPSAFGTPWGYQQQGEQVWIGNSWQAPAGGRDEDPDDWYLVHVDQVEETHERE